MYHIYSTGIYFIQINHLLDILLQKVLSTQLDETTSGYCAHKEKHDVTFREVKSVDKGRKS